VRPLASKSGIVLSSPEIRRIRETLWPADLPGYTRVFAIVDGAHDSRIYGAVDASRQDRCCLYSVDRRWGSQDLHWQLLMNGPYLVDLDPDEEFTRFLLRNGWEHHWAIFFRSDADFQSARRHFRDLLTVRDPSGQLLMFRYYDPRVLRAYLPTCLPGELRAVFGPADMFIVPGEDPRTAVSFRFDGSRLLQDISALAAATRSQL
jgi:hypothetical protein